MPVLYDIDAERSLVRIKASDPVLLADVQEYFRRSRLDVRVERETPRLIDIRGVSALPTTPEFESIARSLNASLTKPTGRVAVVVDSHLGHGVAKMAGGILGLGDQLEVFLSEAEAIHWLSAAD